MAKYIQKETLLERAEYDNNYRLIIPVEAIKAAPAADVAPMVHGRWGTGRFNLETGNYEEQCTRCRNFSKEYGKPYCPNCGAKMDGGAE
nr:MAG TPA: Putative toxin VapC6 domain, ZN ribbon domain [Caudoviricetes sp.]